MIIPAAKQSSSLEGVITFSTGAFSSKSTESNILIAFLSS